MTGSLEEFGNLNRSDEIRIKIDSEGITSFPVIPHFDGETCWERCHPTFLSKKRKVILTTPRKVGHSSIRFYLNEQNARFDDDWVWIEAQNRDPRSWLSEEEYEELVTDLWRPNKRVVLHSFDELPERLTQKDSPVPFTFNAKVLKRGSEDTQKFLGDYNSWDFAQEIQPELFQHGRESEMTPPFQTLSYFKDWTSYLIVRDPWERFISGLITEMDNGMSTPWRYDHFARTEKGWNIYYNSAKSMIYQCEPEWILLGGLEGQQMNHTFILSRPLWNGKSMYDTYDKLIHYKHDIDYEKTDIGHLYPTQNSMEKTAGVIDTLIDLDFINGEIRDEFLQKQGHNMQAHSHMNLTQEIRQRVIADLQDDDDIKDWWKECRDIVELDYDALKSNQSKFVKT